MPRDDWPDLGDVSMATGTYPYWGDRPYPVPDGWVVLTPWHDNLSEWTYYPEMGVGEVSDAGVMHAFWAEDRHDDYTDGYEMRAALKQRGTGVWAMRIDDGDDDRVVFDATIDAPWRRAAAVLHSAARKYRAERADSPQPDSPDSDADADDAQTDDHHSHQQSTHTDATQQDNSHAVQAHAQPDDD